MMLYLATTKISRAQDIENTRVVTSIDEAIEYLAELEVTKGIGNNWRVWEVYADRAPKLLKWSALYLLFIRRVFEKKEIGKLCT